MFNLKTLSLLIASLSLTACGGGGSSTPDPVITPPPTPTPAVEEPVVEPGPFTFAIKTAGEGEAEYLVTQTSISNEALSADGVGIEQQGWNLQYPVGNTLFVSGYENFETTSYKVNDDGDVEKLTSFVFDNPLVMFGSVDDTTLLASDAPSDGTHTTRTLYTVDADTGKVTDKVNYTIHDFDTGTPGEGTVAWPTALVVRDDLLFVPFQKLDDQGWYATPEADTAFVAVFDYPVVDGAQPIKIISDDRASNIGVNGVTSSMIKVDNGDLYTMSNGAESAGFSPAATKVSAILRINDGETEFDANYYFDIEAATDGGKLFWFDYVGDNKAIARIVINEEETAPWSAFAKDLITQKLVIIDLVAKTVTDVHDVPLHQKRYTSPVEIVDGKVYVSVETEESAHVYEVDIENATATKGVEIMGKTIKGFYDLYH